MSTLMGFEIAEDPSYWCSLERIRIYRKDLPMFHSIPVSGQFNVFMALEAVPVV